VTARLALMVAIASVAIPPPASAQAPIAVAERTVTQRDVATRVSLFSNGAVVVTVRRGEEPDFFRRITLPDDQYMIYLSIIQTNAEELEDEPISSRIDTEDSEVVLSLHVGPSAPRSFRFSPMSGVNLALSKIMGAMDDLQTQVFDTSPSAEALRAWVPHEGDLVELMTGQFATVVEIWDDGMIILRHESTSIRESVVPSVRDQVILRIVERAP
jgi:hypothetical protein